MVEPQTYRIVFSSGEYCGAEDDRMVVSLSLSNIPGRFSVSARTINSTAILMSNRQKNKFTKKLCQFVDEDTNHLEFRPFQFLK